MFPILQIGPASLPAPGLIIIISIWVGLNVAEKFSPRFGIKPDVFFNSIALGLVSGVLGARLTFIILHAGEFVQDPRAAFSLNYQLLDFWGGFLFAFIAILIYGQRKGVNWYQYANALTPLIAVLFVALPISDLASGNNFGLPTNLPWAINLWGLDRHPTQVYDLLASSTILIGLFLFSIKPVNGKIRSPFLIFVATTAFSRVILDGFEADPNLIFGGLRAGQVGAWFLLAAALIAYYFLVRKQTT